MKAILENMIPAEYYPLYSGELCGDAYDKSTKYEMIIITKWTNRTKEAKENSRKVYYVLCPNFLRLQKYVKNEEWCEYIFNNYKANSRLCIGGE